MREGCRDQESSGSQHSGSSYNPTGKLELARLPVNTVGQRPAKNVSGHSCKKGQRRQCSHDLEREEAIFEEIRRKPCHVEVCPVVKAAEASCHVPHVGRAETNLPGRLRLPQPV